MSWGETKCEFYGKAEKPCTPTMATCRRGICDQYRYNEKLGPRNPPRLENDKPFA